MPSWEKRRRRQQRTLRKRIDEDKEEGLEDRTVPLEVVKLDGEAKIDEKAIHGVTVRYISSGICSHVA